MGHFCTYETSPDLIDKAILAGILPKFLHLLYTGGNCTILHKILWGLSNITGGYKNHINAFVQEEELVQRVIILIENQSLVIKSEALYVIINAI